MSVRPTLLKDLRRTAIQEHQRRKGTGDYNRYEALSPRGRVFSTGKRQLSQNDSSDSGSAPKAPKLDGNLLFDQLKGQETSLLEVGTILDSVDAANGENKDVRIEGLSKALRLIAKSHETLTSVLLDSTKLPVTQPQAVSSAPAPASGANKGKKNATPAVLDEAAKGEQQVKKLKTVLREAEKKTVLFNLNMGSGPAMNKETLSRKVTEALGKIAKDGKHDYNISDAEDVIDDILSCSKLEFLGTTTKKFFNNRNVSDPCNNTMYTVPVRFEFRDRDTRFQAETSLRKICKVSCSVPYPKKLRLLMDSLVKQGKTTHPDCFIRTKVNIEKLTIEAHAKTADKTWVDLGLKQSFGTEILDNQVSDVPPTQMIVEESSQIS
jgi:hypothetical protein